MLWTNVFLNEDIMSLAARPYFAEELKIDRNIVGRKPRDVCVQIVKQKLHRSSRRGKTECKDGACVNLFWLDAYKSSVTYNPTGLRVICNEALVDIAFDELYESGMLKRPAPVRHRLENIPSLSIALHRHRSMKDDRPRIDVTFASGGNSKYSLMLDTGSTSTHVRRTPHKTSVLKGLDKQAQEEVERMIRQEAKMFAGVATYNDDTHSAEWEADMYGADNQAHMFIVEKRIEETATVGGLAFPLTLSLAGVGMDQAVYPGILGASFNSDFASAVGAFALVPAKPWNLLVGNHALNGYCRTSMRFTHNIAHSHWIVSGNVKIDRTVSAHKFLIDTGASGLFLNKDSYALLATRLEKLGSPLDSTADGNYNIARNCKEYKTRFPNIYYRIAGIDVMFRPEQYINFVAPDYSSCHVMINNANLEASNQVILGTKVLAKLVVKFDRNNQKVGFCHSK